MQDERFEQLIREVESRPEMTGDAVRDEVANAVERANFILTMKALAQKGL